MYWVSSSLSMMLLLMSGSPWQIHGWTHGQPLPELVGAPRPREASLRHLRRHTCAHRRAKTPSIREPGAGTSSMSALSHSARQASSRTRNPCPFSPASHRIPRQAPSSVPLPLQAVSTAHLPRLPSTRSDSAAKPNPGPRQRRAFHFAGHRVGS